MKMWAVMMVAFVAVAGAQPVITNGSFETTDGDQGLNDQVPYFADLVSISSSGWNAEMYIDILDPPLGEINNCVILYIVGNSLERWMF